GTDPARGRRHLAVAGCAAQRDRLPAGLRHRDPWLHPLACVIASVGRTGAWPQAGRISALVLLAALARAAIEPMGEGMATAAFATVLLAGMVLTRPTSPLMGEGWSGGAAHGRWKRGRSL